MCLRFFLLDAGDSFGELLFSLVVDKIECAINSPFNVLYLDDATLDWAAHFDHDLCITIPALSQREKERNPSKSEVTNVNYNTIKSNTAIRNVRTTFC